MHVHGPAWRLATIVCVCVVFISVAVSAAYAGTNTMCLGCHDEAVQMTVPAVDLETVCARCHVPGLVGSHPLHQAGANCGGACHAGWGYSLLSATPSVNDASSGASFASESSKATPAALLHIIHSARRWPADVFTSASACPSCHETAACNACHTGAVSTSHATHALTGSAKYSAEEPWNGIVGRGVVGGDQTQLTALPETNGCSSSGCHALEATRSRRARVVEDYNHSVGQNPADLTASNSALTLLGVWRPRYHTTYTGSRMSFSGTAGSSLSASFTGSRVELVSEMDPYRGKADIYIDDVKAATVDLYSPVTRRQAVVFVSDSLSAGTHEIDVRPLGEKHEDARAAFVVVDAFRVYASVPASIAPACSSCHGASAHEAANHVGTDAAARIGRSNKGGCSDTPAKYQTGCHDITALHTLHGGLADGGCGVCHGPGRAPAAECKTCHDAGATVGYASSARLTPSSDDTLTAGMTVFPVAPTTRFDKVDETTSDADATYVTFTDVGRAVFSHAAPSIPASATITNVTVYYTLRYVSGTAPSNAGASLKIGGQYFNATTPINATTAYAARNFVFATNPKTGAAWTREDIVSQGGDNALQGFGVYSTDAVPNVRITLCYALVNYSVPQYVVTQETAIVHHNNAKYLLDQEDAVPDLYYYPDVYPPGGWSAKFYQDCNAWCHQSYVGSAWSAYAGTMWYSLAGQGQGIPETRTLTLDAGALPDAASLSFKTRWKFDVGSATRGYVEVSTNGGSTWTVLEGTVFGSLRSEYADNSAAAWGDAVYDLSSYAGQQALLRFRYVMPANTAAEGWSIDNVTITGSSGVFYADDVETLKPEWTSVQWYREVAAYRKY